MCRVLYPEAMHRIVVDLAWAVATVYLATVILREVAIVAAPYVPSLTRAIEFGIGTGGVGAGTAS